jgi:hypothetical protein
VKECAGGCGRDPLFRLGVTRGGCDFVCQFCLGPRLIEMVKVFGKVSVTIMKRGAKS